MTDKEPQMQLGMFSIALSVSIIVLSVLQGALFLWGFHLTTYNLAALLFAMVSLLLAIRFVQKGRMLIYFLLLLFYCVQLGLFAGRLIGTEIPPAPRLLQVAIMLLHFGLILSILLVQFVTPFKALCTSFFLVMGIFLFEIVFPLVSPAPENTKGVEWIGSVEPHPNLGAVYHPHSILKTVYPDNPRGYFREEDARERKFWLRTANGNLAEAVYPADDLDSVRIDIKKIQSTAAFDVQLNLSHLKVKAKHRYRVEFRARSDSPRNLFVGFAKSHEPWDGLGLYKKIDLTPDWKTFREDFVSTASDDNSRIHFDLGSSDIAVDFSDVGLRNLPGGIPVEPDIGPKRYAVSYRINALGCRGADYPIPVADGTRRILILGDSYAMGAGVREEDTLTSRLQYLLTHSPSAGSHINYEVINCGVNGYGTQDERLFYKYFGAKYEPNLVLLIMNSDDNLTYQEQAAVNFSKTKRGKFESLFYPAERLTKNEFQRKALYFFNCIDEIRKLDVEVRTDRARLALVIFRNDPDYSGRTDKARSWNNLTRTVNSDLLGSDIPVLDVGKALFQGHSKADLSVHPALDDHPNELAHAIAAEQTYHFLKKENLLSHDIPKENSSETKREGKK